MEVYKEITDYKGFYEISNLSNIKSLERFVSNGKSKRKIKERILKQSLNKRGYKKVELQKNGKQKTREVHQLVAEAFHGHKPCGYVRVVNHINRIKTDNRAVNLEVTTQRENTNKKHLDTTSKYVGVCWDKNSKKWHSRIYVNKKRIHLGLFDSEIKASEAYQNKLKAI